VSARSDDIVAAEHLVSCSKATCYTRKRSADDAALDSMLLAVFSAAVSSDTR